MKEQGFTLIELLAVIVILAIIALIATPIVLNIISNTKENAQLRSAEMYIKGLETSIATSTLNNKKVPDKEYNILPDGNICLVEPTNNTCSDGDTLEVKMNGEKPNSGTVTVLNGKITDIKLKYENEKIVEKDKDGNLVYGEKEILITSLNISYEGCGDVLECIPSIDIEPSNATNKNLEFTISENYMSCGTSKFSEGEVKIDSSTGIITKSSNRQCMGYEGCETTVTAKTVDGSNISTEVKFTIYNSSGWSCLY